MKLTKRLALLALAAAVSLGAAGCSDSGGDESGGGTGGAHLNFGCYNYSNSLDPATNVNSSWCGVRYGITECLFRFDDTVTAVENLCDSYTVSEDHVTWTLHIREGVKFSNGRELTPTAVAASLERLYERTDPERGGTGNSHPESYLVCESITADDAAGTVTLVCAAPTSNIPGILSYPYFAIIDTEAPEDEIIGTGPYAVQSIDSGVGIELVRNESYWNGEVPYDTVSIIFIEDSSTKAMALQSGDVDLVENITTASDLEKLSADPAYYVSTAAGVRTGNSYMNYSGVLQNDALRQAIIMALDSETMCEKTVGGMYTAGISVLPSSLDYGYDELTDPWPYDPAEAIRILDEAGITDTDGDGWRELDGENIDLSYVAFSSRNLNDFAEAVAIQLGEIGIKVTVDVVDYDTALGMQSAGEFDLITSNAITVGVGDPQDFLGNWYSGNSADYGGYVNEEYDALYEQLMVELDGEKRAEIVQQLQQVLIDDAATIVHGYYNSRMFSSAEKVQGADIATIDYYWLTTDIRPAD